ncbi:MAG: spore coat U domain-containing protein [Burkholderiales bacterium]|nr:MAG: spore coat U domain-containing protein [Burkholderiales bacterium]
MKTLIVFLLLCLGAALPRAEAQTCSATVSSIDFGSPDILSGASTDALATLTVSCTGIPLLAVIKMCPSIGAGSAGSNGSARLLTNGTRTLSYQLFQDSGRSQGWGSLDNTQLGTVPGIIIGNILSGAGSATRTIYARLYGDSSAAAGTYVSNFSGSQTTFSYSSMLLGASTSCTGFVGNAIVRPEFTVTASPQPTCTISTTDLDFGVKGVLNAAITGQSSLGIACTQGASWSIVLDGGASGNTAARRMTSPAGDNVSYNLYRDAARTSVWGASAATQATGTGTGNQQSVPVFGTVPAQPTPKPGVYSDRVVATIRY